MARKKHIHEEFVKLDRRATKYPGGYVIEGCTIRHMSNEFGRARGNITCAGCGSISRVFYWSLAGGGKICHGCGGLMSHRGTFYDNRKLLPGQIDFFDRLVY